MRKQKFAVGEAGEGVKNRKLRIGERDHERLCAALNLFHAGGRDRPLALFEMKLRPMRAASFAEAQAAQYQQPIEGTVWITHAVCHAPKRPQFVVIEDAISGVSFADKVFAVQASARIEFKSIIVRSNRPIKYTADEGQIVKCLVCGATLDRPFDYTLNIGRNYFRDGARSPFFISNKCLA